MSRTVSVLAALLVAIASSVAGQTPEQLEAEPIVQLQPGETPVPGQCLTREELDLIAALDALTRPTLGAEGAGGGDHPPIFDPQYFVGTWELEGLLADSPLGPGGEVAGTEEVQSTGRCTYESLIEAKIDDAALEVSSRMIFDRRARYLVRIEDDSRGFQILKMGPVGGDSGGFFSHYWNTPAVEAGGSRVVLSGRTLITSPDAYQLRLRISVDDAPLANLGTLSWRRFSR